MLKAPLGCSVIQPQLETSLILRTRLRYQCLTFLQENGCLINVTDLKTTIIINTSLMDKHAPCIRVKRGLGCSIYICMYVCMHIAVGGGVEGGWQGRLNVNVAAEHGRVPLSLSFSFSLFLSFKWKNRF